MKANSQSLFYSIRFHALFPGVQFSEENIVCVLPFLLTGDRKKSKGFACDRCICYLIEAKWYNFRGKNLLFSFCLPPQWRSTFKEKNLLPQKQIVSLTGDPILEGLRHPGN